MKAHPKHNRVMPGKCPILSPSRQASVIVLWYPIKGGTNHRPRPIVSLTGLNKHRSSHQKPLLRQITKDWSSSSAQTIAKLSHVTAIWPEELLVIIFTRSASAIMMTRTAHINADWKTLRCCVIRNTERYIVPKYSLCFQTQ